MGNDLSAVVAQAAVTAAVHLPSGSQPDMEHYAHLGILALIDYLNRIQVH